MPLARIVTRFPERTFAATEYFRSQGYTVEIVSPGDFRVTPATLEITLDKCTAQQALERARQAVEARQSGAAPPVALPVAPEPPAAQPELAPTAFDITGRAVEFEAPVERRQPGQGFLAAFKSVLQRAWNARRGTVATKISRPRVDEEAGGRTTPVSLQPPVQEQDAERAQREAQQRERAAAAERAQREQIEREQRLRAAAEERARLKREEQERAAREQAAREEQERQRAARERLAAEERERIERETREKAAAAEQARVAAEQARLAAEQQERDRVAAAHEALIAAQRERERIRMQQPAEVPVARAPQPIPAAAPLSALQRAIPAGVRAGSEIYRRAGWKSLLIAGTAVVLLMIAGIVGYANRRPASPLSNSDLVKSDSVKQQTPFGAATVAPAAPIPKPSPAVAPTPTPSQNQHRSVSKRPPAKTRRAARRLRRSTSQDDSVAEDEVVVRHFTKTPPAVTSTATAGMKKYSDMN